MTWLVAKRVLSFRSRTCPVSRSVIITRQISAAEFSTKIGFPLSLIAATYVRTYPLRVLRREAWTNSRLDVYIAKRETARIQNSLSLNRWFLSSGAVEDILGTRLHGNYSEEDNAKGLSTIGLIRHNDAEFHELQANYISGFTMPYGPESRLSGAQRSALILSRMCDVLTV